MQKLNRNKEAISYVYGLDIGTRSIVGTVGYRYKDRFVVVAQQIREHESRAMLDGQIHDIGTVSDSIREVTGLLEEKIGTPLKQVCIAAAGRVLKTVTVHAQMELEEERTVMKEDIHMLDSYGIENAYELFQKENESDMKFYCVGYSVMHYYMNGYPVSHLENHKAKEISADMIATFLPDDVVDGLYKAVELAGLEVANLTLEPIAAIELAIPEMYRMLNIALIDVGAGTSDISITKDGCIIAYGMLPVAGDCLTEDIARHCLVDFHTAEMIKRGIEKQENVEYKDIMGIPQTISREEVLEVVDKDVDMMASAAAEKIKELNGDKSVSAVFVVGGGGKIATYTDKVAQYLGIAKERCAVRGEDVMMKIDFTEKDVVKDSLMVTPIGICLNYYEQSNNFIFVTFNGKRVKLYDNNRLAIIDAAILAEFSNDDLFPKRGENLEFELNGKAMTIRGGRGESANVLLNGKDADIHTAIRSNDVIEVIPSTAGEKATMEVSKLPDYEGSLTINLDGKEILLPKLASVNGQLQSSFYQIQNGDKIELLNYYTVHQILEFMDIPVENIQQVMVNHEAVDLSAKVYDNFTVSLTVEEMKPQMEQETELYREQQTEPQPVMQTEPETEKKAEKAENILKTEVEQAENQTEESTDGQPVLSALEKAKADAEKLVSQLQYEKAENALADMIKAATSGTLLKQESQDDIVVKKSSKELYGSLQKNLNRLKEGTPVTELRKEAYAQENLQKAQNIQQAESLKREENVKQEESVKQEENGSKEKQLEIPPMQTESVDGKLHQILHVVVNGELITLKGKTDYMYVDVFDLISFDLSKPQGKYVETLINGRKAQYTEPLSNGDKLEIYWKD